MSRTYTSASDRDSRLAARRTARFHRGHALLALTSIVGMLVIGLAYAGRISGLDLSQPSAQRRPVTDLNTVSDSKKLEPLLEPVFPNAADRRFAAQGLFDFIRAARDAGDTLPNVGAILRARITAAAIDRAPLVIYHERLREARLRASQTAQPMPAVLPLFTAADLATLKPSAVVRTPAAFARLTLSWGG